MAAERLEQEVEDIFGLIGSGKNFLLSGGAGSGKTYSLVSVINEIYNLNPKARIACITFTNAAVHEIENRVSNSKLWISTIHDFLWKNISPFQEELKSTLIEGINSSEINYKNIFVETPYFNPFNDGIKYTEHLRLANGEISHDEVIVLANQMFKKYPKLCDILCWKYEYILVDEYQDTAPEVIEIFLDFLPKGRKKNIIGFFGDAMQSIYDDGIGDLEEYIKKGCVTEVKKTQNRRNPQLVIDLANKIRFDGLQQRPSTDQNAPNMEDGRVKEGRIRFLYGSNVSLNDIKKNEFFSNWDFHNPRETKELWLTNNLIAEAAGFSELMKIYDKDPVMKLKRDFLQWTKKLRIEIDESQTFDAVLRSSGWTYSDRAQKENRNKKRIEVFLQNQENRFLYGMLKDKPFSIVKSINFDKDNLISDKKSIDEKTSTKSKRDKLIRHLFKIHEIIQLYEKNEYNEFIRKTSFHITKISDKVYIKDKIEAIRGMGQKTIHDVICYAHDSRLCMKDDIIEDFIKSNEYLYSRVSKVKYDQFAKLYDYLEGYTPFSTQHKIKGEEFKNVLIVLDNGRWRDYNFEYLFNPSHLRCNDSVLKRTGKLFYVCCTRAKDNLAVYCERPSNKMLDMAEDWFGKTNCIPI